LKKSDLSYQLPTLSHREAILEKLKDNGTIPPVLHTMADGNVDSLIWKILPALPRDIQVQLPNDYEDNSMSNVVNVTVLKREKDWVEYISFGNWATHLLFCKITTLCGIKTVVVEQFNITHPAPKLGKS